MAEARKVQISGSLRPGQALEVGRLEIRWRSGIATVEYGSAVRVVLCREANGRVKFFAETNGSVLPTLRHEGEPPQPQDTGRRDAPEDGRVDGPAPEPPVLRLGPGGDYVRDYYPKDLAGKPGEESPRNAGFGA